MIYHTSMMFVVCVQNGRNYRVESVLQTIKSQQDLVERFWKEDRLLKAHRMTNKYVYSSYFPKQYPHFR